MKIKKKALVLAGIASMIAMMFAIGPAYASTTLWAPTIIDPTKVPSTTLVVDINISDVTNLWSFEFELKYDPAILEPVLVYDRDGNTVNDTPVTPMPPFDSASGGLAWGTPTIGFGIVGDAYSGPFGASSGLNATASTRIATVTFHVIGTGGSYLDLQNTALGGIGIKIYHTIVDGYFANVAPDMLADLVKRKAWAEFRQWRLSNHGSMNLFAKVKSLGNSATQVKARFHVTKGVWFRDFFSDVYTLGSGQTTTLRTEPSIEPSNLDPADPYGTYFVTAFVIYDSDGEFGIDTEGTTTKSFKFVLKA